MRFIQSSILSVALAVAATAAFAQAPQSTDHPRGPRPHGQFQGRPPDHQMEVKMLPKRRPNRLPGSHPFSPTAMPA